MPILPAEPEVFPPELLDPTAATDPDRSWFVLHTKPRQEKSLARQLLADRVPFYLPCLPHRTQSRGRIFTSRVPLFPGYLFLLGNTEERFRSDMTNRVANAIAVPDQARLWCDLRQVKRLLDCGRPVTPEVRLTPGDTVTIQSGPLLGLTGTVVRVAGNRKLLVRVDFIQKGASIELDDGVQISVHGDVAVG
jgi:transcriptional antiterminator RfaH